MSKVNNKNSRATSLTLFWCFYCYLWTYFTLFSRVSTVVFERLNISWILISCTVFNNPFQANVFPCFWSFSIIQLDHDCSLRTVTFQSSVNLNLCTGLVVLSDIIFWLKKKHSLKLLQYLKCAFNICLIFCF